MKDRKVDVIVVGAGPAGVSAAVVLSRAGKKVLLVERSDNAGDKNMFGGCIYTAQTNEIFPSFFQSAPVERSISEHKIVMLTDTSSVEFSHKSDCSNSAYTVNRSKWDRWCVEQAQKEGVYYAPKTLVTDLLVVDGKVIGIQTQFEKYYSDIVIIADGVNSLLAKQIGMRKNYKDSNVTVNVKEVYKLPKQRLEDRFNISENNGVAVKILGGPLKDVFAMGFLYTNKDSISIGLGISLDELKKLKIKPHELLDNLKEHSSIAPYLKDAEFIEYSAHMIPEGSFDTLPKLYSDGVLLTGDAAGFVNNIHFEGSNLAMLSGKLAAETAICAINNKDFSSKSLSLYYKKLKKSIIIKDLKTHSNTIPVLKKHIKTITSLYPQLLCEFLSLLSLADGVEKRKKYMNFVFNVFKTGVIFKSIPLVFFAMEKCFKK